MGRRISSQPLLQELADLDLTVPRDFRRLAHTAGQAYVGAFVFYGLLESV